MNHRNFWIKVLKAEYALNHPLEALASLLILVLILKLLKLVDFTTWMLNETIAR